MHPKTKHAYALGGLATAQKGITTEEGLTMAEKKFQLDRKNADTNGDGKLSKYEELSGEATQKTVGKDELVEMYHGGLMCGDEDFDEVSGNEIPIGSSAENVRDDIPAMLSDGEYVLPANVVKWHGIKHILAMQDEAEMGLMGMYAEGLIPDLEPEDGEDTDHEMAEMPDEEMADDNVPEEGVEVEVATVMVDDQMDDSEEDEELTPQTSGLLGKMNNQRFAFIS
jgi:hypothetical protein